MDTEKVKQFLEEVRQSEDRFRRIQEVWAEALTEYGSAQKHALECKKLLDEAKRDMDLAEQEVRDARKTLASFTLATSELSDQEISSIAGVAVTPPPPPPAPAVPMNSPQPSQVSPPQQVSAPPTQPLPERCFQCKSTNVALAKGIDPANPNGTVYCMSCGLDQRSSSEPTWKGGKFEPKDLPVRDPDDKGTGFKLPA